MNHLNIQQVLLYQVMILLFFTIDVPFTNGKIIYKKGNVSYNHSFKSLSESGIISDESIPSLFFIISYSIDKTKTPNSFFISLITLIS